MIIACEDANTNKSDWDMNDVVFLMYGEPYVPKPIIYENDEAWESVLETRYMAEDLGNCDFDFNDVVIDLGLYNKLKRTVTKQKDPITQEETTISDVTETIARNVQRATIRHLGGTLPWEFLVGGVSITGKRYGAMDVDLEEDFTLPEGAVWIPGKEKNDAGQYVEIEGGNNVALKVYNTDGTTEVSTGIKTSFPGRGTTPYMIATDVPSPDPKQKTWADEKYPYFPITK